MSQDYYTILAVDRAASLDDIKKAHDTLSITYHPSAKFSPEDIQRFKEIKQAYDILGNSVTRSMYDDGWIGRTYTEVVGKSAHINIHVTLEELLTGVTKIHTMKRRTYDPIKDDVGTELKQFQLVIHPGCINLFRFTYPKESHRERSTGMEIRTPGDVVFTVREKAHPVYIRNGANLECRKRITLGQALTGVTIDVPTLDGRTLQLCHTAVIKPDTVQRIQGEGLPYDTEPERRGDIIINFDIVFPEHMPQISQAMLNSLRELS